MVEMDAYQLFLKMKRFLDKTRSWYIPFYAIS